MRDFVTWENKISEWHAQRDVVNCKWTDDPRWNITGRAFVRLFTFPSPDSSWTWSSLTACATVNIRGKQRLKTERLGCREHVFCTPNHRPYRGTWKAGQKLDRNQAILGDTACRKGLETCELHVSLMGDDLLSVCGRGRKATVLHEVVFPSEWESTLVMPCHTVNLAPDGHSSTSAPGRVVKTGIDQMR